MRTGKRLLERPHLDRSKFVQDCPQSFGSRSTSSIREFFLVTEAAGRILEYVNESASLRAFGLEFGYGMTQGPRRAVARFSGWCRQRNSKVLILVTADACAGDWSVRHSMLLAE